VKKKDRICIMWAMVYIVAMTSLVVSAISCEMGQKKKRNQETKTEQIQKSKGDKMVYNKI